ncbi:MAG TPA: hypothetical protein VH063_08860 [Gaiellaceae bacterium]|jgi:hypothetical protein|nr:hypothetical protein [Gaiellaceae bacterium]
MARAPGILAVLALTFTSTATGKEQPRTISAAGATLRIPSGWHAVVARTSDCDPQRLVVVSSAPLHVSSAGRFAAAPEGQVVVVLMQSRDGQDRLGSNHPQPTHFSIDWNRLVRLLPSHFCGNPGGRASQHIFKARGRYIGFLVYPTGQVGPPVRAGTLAVMDSLRVRA